MERGSDLSSQTFASVNLPHKSRDRTEAAAAGEKGRQQFESEHCFENEDKCLSQAMVIAAIRLRAVDPRSKDYPDNEHR